MIGTRIITFKIIYKVGPQNTFDLTSYWAYIGLSISPDSCVRFHVYVACASFARVIYVRCGLASDCSLFLSIVVNITKNMDKDKNKNMTKQRTRTRLGTMQAQERDARQEQDKT